MSSDEHNIVNQITLECLINKEQYNKYLNSKKNVVLKKKEQKFYRKRILSMTKDFLYSDGSGNNIPPDLQNQFNDYIKTCIQYFKGLDKSDILQEDYLDILEETLENTGTNYDSAETNKLIMVRPKPNTLDNFVKRVNTANAPILPKKRSVNLKEPYLKEKGLQKKNINDNYNSKDIIQQPDKNENPEKNSEKTPEKNSEKTPEKNPEKKPEKNTEKKKKNDDKSSKM